MKIRKCLSAAATIAVTGAGMALMTPSPASAAGACVNPNANPALTSTKRSAVLYGRLFELRYNSGSGCAWGRVSRGNPNDEVWVDWAETQDAAFGGRRQQLGKRRTPHGLRGTTTPGYFDGDANVMRTCGKAGDRVAIVCTNWY